MSANPHQQRLCGRTDVFLSHPEFAHFWGGGLQNRVTKLAGGTGRELFLSSDQFGVFAMGTDPKPNHGIPIHDPECPVMIGDPCRPVILNFLELDRGVTWIIQPKPVLLVCRPLNIPRQEMVASPKGACRSTLHEADMGRSGPRGIRKRPPGRDDPVARL